MVILSACNSNTNSSSGPSGSNPAQAKEPKPVVVVQGVDVFSMDPHVSGALSDANVQLHIFETLVNRDEKMNLVPGLAEKWSLEADNLTWTFNLRKDVKFSNGEEFNAAAAKFAFDRALDPKNQTVGNTRYLLNNMNLDTVMIKDANTLQIKTKQPSATLPGFLTEFWMIAPKYYTETSKEKVGLAPIGSGPYVLQEWKKDERVVLERREDYWGKKPAIKTIIFRPIPELATRIAELETGGADIIVNVAPDKHAAVNGLSNARLESVQGGRRIFVGLTQYGNPYLKDARVRQALNYAVDFDAIIKSLLNGIGERKGVNVNAPWANPNVKPYPYDVAKAKALLAEVGFTKTNGDGLLVNEKGETLKLTFNTPNGRYIKDKDIAMAIGADLRKAGVDVEVLPQEWSAYVAKLDKFDVADLFLIGSGSSFEGQADISDVQAKSGSNYAQYNNPEFEQRWAKLVAEVDMEKRRALLNEMQEILKNDPPYIFLYMQVDSYGVSKRLNWKPLANERIKLFDATVSE